MRKEVARNLRDEAAEWVARIRSTLSPGDTGGAGAIRTAGSVGTGRAQFVRGAVGRGLGIPEPEDKLLADLVAELETQEVPCRLEVAFTLARSREAFALPALERLALDPSPAVRLAVVDGLARIGGQRAVLTLVALAENDTNELVRVQALAALGVMILLERASARMGAGGAYRTAGSAAFPTASSGGLPSHRIVESLAVRDPSPRVREAAQALLKVLDEDAQP